MKGYVPPDPQTDVSQVRFAVVYEPRRKRTRFPTTNVTLVESKEAALAGAEPARKRYPACVLGPSKSSEGLHIFYLVEWLD